MKRIAVLLLVLLLIPISPGAGAEALDPAGIKAAVDSFLTAEMDRQAGLAATEWERYLYAQGVAEIAMDLAKFDITKGKPLAVTFLVASGQPDLKNLPPYQSDPAPFLASVVQSMGTRNATVKLNLQITEQDGYLVTYAKNAEAALQKAVKGLAATAQKAMGDKKLLAALVDYLMPTPIILPQKAPDNLALQVKNLAYEAYVQRNGTDLSKDPFTGAMLYGIKGQTLNASYGPEKLVLEYTVPYLSPHMQTSADKLCEELAYDAKAKEYTDTELMPKLASQVEKNVVAYRYGKKSDVKETYQFSLLDLPKALTPADFYHHETEGVNTMAAAYQSKIANAVAAFPDYPAIRDPKSGVVAGADNGAKISFKVKRNDGFNRCISIYNMDSQRVSVVYLAAGKNTSFRIPDGDYYFVFGAGKAWYGPDNLFGPAGGYMITKEDVNRDRKGWRQSITLPAIQSVGEYPFTFEEIAGW